MTSIVSSWLFGSDTVKPSPPNPIRAHLPQAPILHPHSLPINDKKEREQTPEEALDALLEQYKTSTVPAASRFNGELDPQREGKPPGVLDLWRHAWFVATKTKDIVQDVALYHLRGPRRPSWNIEMTMLAAFMRNMAANTHLIDVPTLRFAMSFGGLIPTPSDALITPVTFRIRRRGLRGFLRKWDELENGKREIQSEWVVGKRLWQRLQREWKGLQQQQQQQQRGGGSSHRSTFRHSHSSHHHHNKVKERVVLFLHGGAYYTASAATHRLVTISLSKQLDARVFAINYRLAPDTRFPGPVHDAVSAYLRLTEDLGVPPGNVIVAGDSAGGGLCVALMMYLRDEGYPLPGAAILMCPWVDLTMSCASWDTNAELDVITFPTDPADHMNPVACYLGPQGMSRFMTHPYASPLFGDFTGLPPMLVQAGDCEVLRDEVTLLAHKATLAGVDVVHEVYEDAVHVFQLYPFLEQSRKAFRACRKFVLESLPTIQARRKEKERTLSRHASATTFDAVGLGLKGLSTPMEEAPTVDLPVFIPTPTRTPVSPPLTPTALTPRRLDRPATPVSESGASVDEGSTSSSDDAHLSERVETALEREISGTGTDREPIVVDAYGTEEPRSRASSMSLTRPGEEDESMDDEDNTSSSSLGLSFATSPLEDVKVVEDEKANASAGPGTGSGLFASIPWRFTRSSKSSSQLPTTSIFSLSSSSAAPPSNSPLAYSRSAITLMPTPTRTDTHRSYKPTSPTRPKSKSIASSTTPQLIIEDTGTPPSSSSASTSHINSYSSFALTPVTRAPPVPETRTSPTMSTLALPRVPRPVSSSHISPRSSTMDGDQYGDDGDDGNDAGTTRRAVRERTTSHPDMVKLMREYAQMGPAQMTTTYARQAASLFYPSSPSTSASAVPGSNAAGSKAAGTTTRSRGGSLSGAIRKGASASASAGGHKPTSPASPVQ